MLLLYGLYEVQNRVIDGRSVSSLAHGFLRLGRIGSHDMGYVWLVRGGGEGGMKDWSSEHMLLSAGLRRAFAMCGLSSAVCLTPRERCSTGWTQPTDTWAAAGGGSLTDTHTAHIHTINKEKLSLLLAGLSEENSWACREDSYQLIVLPHLSVAP